MKVNLDGSEIGDDRPQEGQRGMIPRSPDTSMGVQVSRDVQERLTEKPQQVSAGIGSEGLIRVAPTGEPGAKKAKVMYQLDFPHASGPIHITCESYTVDVEKRMMNFYRGGDVCAQFRIPEGIWWGISIVQ